MTDATPTSRRAPPPWASHTAVARASALGINATMADFRDAFLAITDAVLGVAGPAMFVGRTRDAERWTVPLAGVPVEVLYNPAIPLIFHVEASRPRRGGQAVAAPTHRGGGSGEAVQARSQRLSDEVAA
jgi:hypothetical protein